MNIEKAKKILKEKAKEWFSEIPKDKWYMETTEWKDGSFRVTYCHGEEDITKYEIEIYYGDIKKLTVEKRTVQVYESKVLK